MLVHVGFPTVKLPCPRASKDVERTFSKNRILYAHLANPKGSNNWKKIEIGEALDIIAEKLEETIKQYGSSSVLFLDYAGNRGVFTRYLTQRLWYLLEATRIDYGICDGAGINALELH